MSLASVSQRIDDWLTPKWSNLVNKQDDYFTAHGRYFQGLWTHANEIIQTDANDGDQLPDRLLNTPTDQRHTWIDFIATALTTLQFPARLRMDVYDGPRGKGWSATLQVRYEGTLYEKTQQVGLETYRTHDWINRD